jgi:serine/threonine-protein phosphatase 5
VKIYPSNKEAQEKLKQCEKLVRQIAFEDAIAVEEVSTSDSIDLNEIGTFETLITCLVVESSYDGPHLTSPITKEFVVSLMEDLKKQKKLHVKYTLRLHSCSLL